MKFSNFSLLFFFMFAFAAFAQNSNNGIEQITIEQETDKKIVIRAGYGVSTVQSLINEFSNLDATLSYPGLTRKDKKESFGTIFVSGNYLISENISIGIDFGYSHVARKYENAAGDLLTVDNSYYYIMPKFDYTWYKSLIMDISSGVGVGFNFDKQKFDGRSINKDYIAFQASVLKVSVGSDYGAFGELGFGNRGVLALGVYAKF